MNTVRNCLTILLLISIVSCNKDEAQIADEMNETSIISDYEGNTYNTIKIGTQWWMAENLKSTKYNEGTDIPMVTDNTIWENLSTPGYTWYDNDQSNGESYGGLYNWYTVNTGNLCPIGWHVSTDEEWVTLTSFLGGESLAGAKLKETGTTHWSNPNTGATNETGFTALPGGLVTTSGSFSGDIGESGYWWSAEEKDIENIPQSQWNRVIDYDDTRCGRGIAGKRNGLSVRCLMD